MKDAWRRARAAYEHVEGAMASIFPELDVSTDERYDGFVANAPDPDLFDGRGVTGVHAVERILWSDSLRPEVVTFEQRLRGYRAPAFPASADEAHEFKEGLLGRLVTDVTRMRDDFGPLALDHASAYYGVPGSMAEQKEKVQKAATGEEESRYANETLADMRGNLAGGRATIEAFTPWLSSETGGPELDAQIKAGFDRLAAAYDAQAGPSLAPPPPTWSSVNPSPADLTTPFGQLFGLLRSETDEKRPDSTVGLMARAAALMGISAL